MSGEVGHATTGSGLRADEATEELLGHRRQQHRPTERWRERINTAHSRWLCCNVGKVRGRAGSGEGEGGGRGGELNA